MKKPELLAPGGSFLSAYHAFEAGADGVYLGMKEFSARKSAANFTLDQLRKIRQLAAVRGKRIYVAMNTVIRQEELRRAAESLAWLEALEVDGVIVQDLGLCELIADRFPRVPIHASTQMAIHNDAGLRLARDMGIRRVILSRELPLDRIAALRERNPDVELEVFVHGALCYSLSGACLASWALTGRSGNRGECAQVCRSLFREPAGPQGSIFSCRDLFLGRDALLLARAGVDALKIEGRMKSPEYVYNVTRLYRSILDRGEELAEAEYQELVRRVEQCFSRGKTSGYLKHASGVRLIDASFPGHRGALLGTVSVATGREIEVRLDARLSLRDGLGYFPAGSQEMLAFSALSIRKGARQVRFAEAGDRVSIGLPGDAGISSPPAVGTEIRHLSSRFLDLPEPKEAGFAAYRFPLDITVVLTGAGEEAVLEARAKTPELPVTFRHPLVVERARRRRPFVPILEELLRESAGSLFGMRTLTFENHTGLAEDEIFVPPSVLKAAKNALYELLDAGFHAFVHARAAPVETGTPGPDADSSGLPPIDPSILADRAGLSPPAGLPVPYAGNPSSLVASDLAQAAGFRFLPLPPFMTEEARWIEALARLAGENPDLLFAVGLDNPSHVEIAQALRSSTNLWFFADLHLYVANSRTLQLLERRVPRLLFAYAWIEGEPADAALLAATTRIPVVRINGSFTPPLFYSMGCFARHVLNRGECFDDCPKDFARDLSQGRNRFKLIVRDCVTYLFASGGAPRGRAEGPP